MSHSTFVRNHFGTRPIPPGIKAERKSKEQSESRHQYYGDGDDGERPEPKYKKISEAGLGSLALR